MMLNELMVAVAISLGLLAVVLGIYFAAQRTMSRQYAMMTIQSNAETALALLKDEIHHAGQIGYTTMRT